MTSARSSVADDRAEIDALGRALARGRRAGTVNVADLHLVTSMARAEAVQDDAVLAYGSPVEGHVLSATTSVCARLLQCETPIAAPMFAANRIDDGGALTVSPTLLGVGAELQFRFGRSYPAPGDDTAALDSLRDAIVACHVGLQVLGRRFGHGTVMNSWTATADFGLAAHHVRGAALTGWRDRDLRSLDLSLEVDGHEAGSGHAGDALGDPIAAVSWLARAIALRGSGIEAGTFVAIGSCTGLAQLVPGHTYTGRFGTAQSVSLRTV